MYTASRARTISDLADRTELPEDLIEAIEKRASRGFTSVEYFHIEDKGLESICRKGGFTIQSKELAFSLSHKTVYVISW